MLSALLYIVYTLDIPDLIHDHTVSIIRPITNCDKCGSNVCYIDDCSSSISGETAADLSRRLTEEYEKISSYMAANQLVINDDKLHLIVFANKANSKERENVSIQAGALVIKPTTHEKLLGCHISQSLKWNEHLIDNKESLINQLNKRLNGLSLVCERANFKTRLMVANGIFCSKLVNLIQIWGGAQDYLIRAVQVTQNKAARMVSRMSW